MSCVEVTINCVLNPASFVYLCSLYCELLRTVPRLVVRPFPRKVGLKILIIIRVFRDDDLEAILCMLQRSFLPCWECFDRNRIEIVVSVEIVYPEFDYYNFAKASRLISFSKHALEHRGGGCPLSRLAAHQLNSLPFPRATLVNGSFAQYEFEVWLISLGVEIHLLLGSKRCNLPWMRVPVIGWGLELVSITLLLRQLVCLGLGWPLV